MAMNQNISEHKYLFHRGEDHRAYEFLGAHPVADLRFSQPAGYVFRVWAPRAKAISVVGSFNNWDPQQHPMHPLEDDPQIWTAVVDNAKDNDLYKFAITTDTGRTIWKADPYAFFSENGATPGSERASIVHDLNTPFFWRDRAWMERHRRHNFYKAPVNIYEVHMGSWRRREDGSVYSYREVADQLIPYVVDMGYTHIELLPIMEYPFDGSWGYQVTGYYSPTSRYGSPEDLKYFIDRAHRANIGVIIDWVPAHFPKDEYGLTEFDGHPLYEDSNPLRAEHKGWGTKAFDFGRPEVLSFLISNAYYYCEQFHVDGLRVDAVAAMIYLNYGRQEGQWMPNEDGGVENKEAIAFLQRMNRDVLTDFPGVMTIAEESTAWPNITKPPQVGGLGFNFKWNMGWMNDELEYFSSDPLFRGDIHGKLIFSIDYAWSENFILPISHDEVVHGKKSLLDKMPGEYDEKFNGYRTFMAYMFTHPGKKLTFMGTEFAQFIEWNENAQLDWLLLGYDRHLQAKEFNRDLNHYYKNTPSLWSGDDTYQGFQWIDGGNVNDNVITFLRYRTDEHYDEKTGETSIERRDPVVVCLNLSGRDLDHYKVGVPEAAAFAKALDTDDIIYGGRGIRTATKYDVIPEGWNGYAQHIELALPALSAIILEKMEV